MRSLILCVLLVGCSSTPPAPTTVDTACYWVPHLTASSSDTAYTKREILDYETTRQINCPATSK